MSLTIGHRVETLSEEEVAELSKIGVLFKDGAVKIHPEKVLLPSHYLNLAEKYFSLKSRPSDVIVAGFLKTGTTWMQDIVWSMTNDPNLVSEFTPEIYLKSHLIEMDLYNKASDLLSDPNVAEVVRRGFPNLSAGQGNLHLFDLIDFIPGRRVLKTHLMPSLLNPQMLKTPKIICAIRDPKDTLVSLYSHHKMFKIYSFGGNMEEFAEAFMAGKVVIGEYPNHIRQWWPYRNKENVHFVYYEELKRNTMEELKKIDKFLETNLSETQLERIMHATSFDEMRKKKTMLNFDGKGESHLFHNDVVQEIGSFYRKGVVGSWKEELTSELNQKYEVYLRDALQGIPLPYEYLHQSSVSA